MVTAQAIMGNLDMAIKSIKEGLPTHTASTNTINTEVHTPGRVKMSNTGITADNMVDMAQGRMAATANMLVEELKVVCRLDINTEIPHRMEHPHTANTASISTTSMVERLQVERSTGVDTMGATIRAEGMHSSSNNSSSREVIAALLHQLGGSRAYTMWESTVENVSTTNKGQRTNGLVRHSVVGSIAMDGANCGGTAFVWIQQ